MVTQPPKKIGTITEQTPTSGNEQDDLLPLLEELEQIAEDIANEKNDDG